MYTVRGADGCKMKTGVRAINKAPYLRCPGSQNSFHGNSPGVTMLLFYTESSKLGYSRKGKDISRIKLPSPEN